MSVFRCLGRTKVSVQVLGFVREYFVTKIHFYSEELLAPRPTPKVEDHALSAVSHCSFNIFVATLHIGGRSSIRNPRTRHAVVTGTHLQHGKYIHCKKKIFYDSIAESASSSNRTGTTLLWESSCNNERSYGAYAGNIL
jgi:hypothetical protein